MKKAKIKDIKAAIRRLYPEANRIQYHPSTDTFSGCGWQLASPDLAVGVVDRCGNGRYVLAEYDYGYEGIEYWRTSSGQVIEIAS